MSMSRKDYVMVAEQIRAVWDQAADHDDCERWRAFMVRLVTRFATEFAKDNPRFDAARFWVACTGEEEGKGYDNW